MELDESEGGMRFFKYSSLRDYIDVREENSLFVLQKSSYLSANAKKFEY